MKNTAFNIASIRNDFPILNSKVNGKQLVYLDNAATTQTPKVVIDSIVLLGLGYYLNNKPNSQNEVEGKNQQDQT